MSLVHDEALENRFIELVTQSWQRYEQFERSGWLDDVFMGGVITAHLQRGYFLLDCTSDGSSHYLMFSDQNKDRYIVRMDHRLGEDILFSKTVGHLAGLYVGFSRPFPDLSRIMRAVKTEIKSDLAGAGRVAGFQDPGVMQIDNEGTFATCQTMLLIDVGDYVDMATLKVDIEKLWSHLSAAYQSVQKFLLGIMA
ncbi:MAG: hypothetical protein HY319_06315 [Armatimonadetes bacterium]|nr:hypothetical protein [Armatimonadota bacterium]